ncbi:MAG: hypothetical protein K0S99_3015, partial [Thermomicrobiales bacterium]|nr:hypothetical protein [Thermomicrobiales bacterium]
TGWADRRPGHHRLPITRAWILPFGQPAPPAWSSGGCPSAYGKSGVMVVWARLSASATGAWPLTAAWMASWIALEISG